MLPKSCATSTAAWTGTERSHWLVTDAKLKRQLRASTVVAISLLPLDLLELRWLFDHEAHLPCCSYLHGTRIHKYGHYLPG